MIKKLTLLSSFALLALLVGTSDASAQKVSTVSTTIKPAVEWTVSTTGTWIGNDRLFYKLTASDKTIWSSVNGTSAWNQIKTGIWQDKSGKWIKVEGTKLIWSADQGLNWRDLPEGTWEGGDGKFYKFNASWQLMVKK